MSKQYDLYRFIHGDGSSKDWAFHNNGDGTYTLRWGKTGTKLQTKAFENAQPLQNRILEKTKKGYQYVGQVMIDDDGNITKASPASSKPAGEDPQPTQDEARIYWRIKIPSNVDSTAVSLLKGLATGYAIAILRAYPGCAWVEKIKDGHGDFVKPSAGSLLKENGVGSLLLLMTLKKKGAPNGVTVSISQEDGVEISDQLKLESQALSFFDTDLESVRSIAESIDLLDKRLDLSTVETFVDDFYF
jgi:predicted DNA-binding WGR domain protein